MLPAIKRFFSDKTNVALLIMALGLLTYTTIRAITVSMTHDESSTFFNYLNRNLFACFFTPNCWGTANLHITNSLLMQITVGLFGSKELFVRMPNLFGHIIYLLFSARLIKAISPNIWVAIAGFLVINANPYFLDFFSLGRGYGLAAAFTMMSFYYLYQYFNQPSIKHIAGCFTGAFLAVISNFTYLNYFAPLVAFVGLGTLVFLLKIENRLPILAKAPFGSTHTWRPLIAAIITTLALVILLYVPITSLRKLGEFEYGVGSLWETLNSLTRYSLKGEGYFGGKKTIRIFAILTLVISLLSTGTGLALVRKRTAMPQHLFYFGVSLIALVLVMALLTQFYVLGTKYLAFRTATIFIPITGVMLFLFLDQLARWKKTIGVGVALAFAAFTANHFYRSANLTRASEWYYDEQSRNMVEYVSAQVAPGDTVSLGVYWIYHPSTRFYRDTRKLYHIRPMNYHKPIFKDTRYDYYYVEIPQGKLLHEDYELVKKFGWVGALYKRKTKNKE